MYTCVHGMYVGGHTHIAMCMYVHTSARTHDDCHGQHPDAVDGHVGEDTLDVHDAVALLDVHVILLSFMCHDSGCHGLDTPMGAWAR